MAVSKRTRYEVLRRDGHTCQYCGEKAPNVTLHVDHVVPKALGGSDNPDNLVTACRDCNAGKASTRPNEDWVAQVSEKSSRHREQLAYEGLRYVTASTRVRANYELYEAFHDAFSAAWETAGFSIHEIGKASMFRWWLMGMPEMFMLEIVDDMGGRTDRLDQPFRYFASVMWSTINSHAVDLYDGRPLDAQVYTQSEVDRIEQQSFSTGWEVGIKRGQGEAEAIVDG